MRQEIKNHNITWINIVNPDKKDVEFLKKNFNLCHSILKEYIPRIKRPKVEEYKNYAFAVIHFPVFNRKTRKTIATELDIILFENMLITNHTGTLPELKKMFEQCNSNETAKNFYIKNNASYLILYLLDRLIDTRLPMLDHIDDHIENIEEKIFKGDEKKMVNEIAIVKHDIISFRRTIKPQRMVLESLIRIMPKLTNSNLSRLPAEVIGSNIRVWNTLENHKEMIEALEHTNESLLSHKIGDTMKILTAFSVIVLPLSLIANVFGMNIIKGMPFINSPFGFWIVLYLMFIITSISFIFFKYKKWL
ncbi:MAG: magnesium transporter CorA family protein [Candidatus Pacebacteria bacterium]|nr:magnesium transporter CorA family protein [Candidatus Paceibacterota bacterium]